MDVELLVVVVFIPCTKKLGLAISVILTRPGHYRFHAIATLDSHASKMVGGGTGSLMSRYDHALPSSATVPDGTELSYRMNATTMSPVESSVFTLSPQQRSVRSNHHSYIRKVSGTKKLRMILIGSLAISATLLLCTVAYIKLAGKVRVYANTDAAAWKQELSDIVRNLERKLKRIENDNEYLKQRLMDVETEKIFLREQYEQQQAEARRATVNLRGTIAL